MPGNARRLVRRDTPERAAAIHLIKDMQADRGTLVANTKCGQTIRGNVYDKASIWHSDITCRACRADYARR